jgi:nucleoside-diphosphate-sugar epimerase
VKVVVTGAAGFIGSHLVESLLADGHEVVGVDAFVDYYAREIKERNLTRAREHAGFSLIEGEVQALDLRGVLDGAGQVYHLAAQAGVRASWGRHFQVYTEHNVLGTQRVLEAAVNAGVPRLVYASSSSVYGDTEALPLREDSPCRPVSPYGVTKLAAENLALLYERNHGLATVSLRYFTAYGPRQRPDMAFHRFLKATRDGQVVHVFGDGLQTRDFTYVADIVAATRRAAESGLPGGVYNVGGGERISILEVLDLVRQVTGREVRVQREEAQKGDMKHTFADTRAAVRDLGFQSSISLAEGLAREWRWICELA